MPPNPRHETILDLVNKRGSVAVVDLVSRCTVSAQTIRNDLRDLDGKGLVHRTHGGARKRASVTNRAYTERRLHNRTAKTRIAALTAALIPDHAAVSLNIGTTTEHVADALTSHQGLFILSNNINIINRMMESRCRELVLVGGTIRPDDGAIVGDEAVAFLSRYKVDFAIIGASSLDPDGAVLDFDPREVAVARALLKNARHKILVCDHSKFETSAPIRICDVADLDYVITDRDPPGSFRDRARSGNTDIITP